MFFNYTEHPGKTSRASAMLAFIGTKLMKLFYNIRIELPEAVPENGPLLIISKHSTERDIPLGYAAMQDHLGRKGWCIMKSSLARRRYMGFFWKIGGIPLDRARPEKSKDYLVYARKVLYELDWTGKHPGDGNAMVLFPEETTYWKKMGEGQSAGFRFITGKPVKPLKVICVGFQYGSGFRPEVLIKFGPVREYSRSDDPAIFLHERMEEIAELSGLDYPYPAPAGRRKTVESV